MNQNVEGVILIKKEGNIVGFVRNDLEQRRSIFYKAEEMSFGDLQELFKDQN